MKKKQTVSEKIEKAKKGGEREDHELLQTIGNKIKETQWKLRLHYQSADESLGGVIHDSVQCLYDLRRILLELIIDKTSAKMILENMKGRSK